MRAKVPARRCRIVVVGGGFAGLTFIQNLKPGLADITLVDRTNHHVFQPLLYQVATAALSPADIAQPLRSILRGGDITVRLDEVVGIDRVQRTVLLGSGTALPYDILVLATGVEYNYFAHPAWADHTVSLKTIADATIIRERVLAAFERAEAEPDARKRQRILTFVLVGGGPTGVEMAGSLAELARFTLKGDYRHFDPRAARIVLVEAGERLLGSFAPQTSRYAFSALRRLGVDVRLATRITAIDAEGVALGGERIGAGLVIWCAGVKGTAAATWLGVDPTPQNTVPVTANLSVPGEPCIFVLGDLASVKGADGKPLPQIASVAKQQGVYLARHLGARLASKDQARSMFTRAPAFKPFRYHNPGTLAVIGRASAVAEFGRYRFWGWFGWLVWGIAHVWFLIGFRNRFAVFSTWVWEWWTDKRGARLITGRGM